MGNETVDWLHRTRRLLKQAEAMKEATRSRLTPDFCALGYLHHNEPAVSKLLADLLNPQGTHGQGGAFLEAFLARFWPTITLNSSSVEVKAEARTDLIGKHRRMLDVRVIFRDQAGVSYALGIENKVWGAADQTEQVSDYLSDLDRRSNTNHKLIYLCQHRNQMPSSLSINEADAKKAIDDDRLVLCGFEELIPWLRDCIGRSDALRVRSFLDELIVYINQTVLGQSDMTDHDLIVKAATEDVESLRAALEISSVRDAIYRSVVTDFVSALYERTAELNLPQNWKLHVGENIYAQYARVSLGPDTGQSRYSIAIAFDRANLGDATVGVLALIKPDKFELEMVRAALNRGIAITCDTTSIMWPWWQHFESHRHWNTTDALCAMKDPGENGMVSLTLRQFGQILDVLKKENLLDQLN